MEAFSGLECKAVRKRSTFAATATRNWARLSLTLVMPYVAAACSTQQAYYSLQGWQQQQCNSTPDHQERERCLQQASRSFDTYRKQQNDDNTRK